MRRPARAAALSIDHVRRESLIGQTIVLGGVELTITDDLSITGLGAADLTISGNNASGVFSIDAGVTVEISDVTIADGSAHDGGAHLQQGHAHRRQLRVREQHGGRPMAAPSRTLARSPSATASSPTTRRPTAAPSPIGPCWLPPRR